MSKFIHLGFRTKIFLGAMLFTIGVAFALSFSVYLMIYKDYYSHYIDDKILLAHALASSIDGDVHSKFVSYKYVNDKEYQRYFSFFNKVYSKQHDITYLYTVNLNPADGQLYYGIDAIKVKTDTVWVESDDFAFMIGIDENGILFVENNLNRYVASFEVQIPNENVQVEIIKTGQSDVLLFGKSKIVEVIKKPTIKINTADGVIDKKNRSLFSHISTGKQDLPVMFSYNSAGDSESDPGAQYNDSPESEKLLKEVILSGRDYVDNRTHGGIYGETQSIYSIIRNREGKSIGAVAIDLSLKDVEVVKKSVVWIFVVVMIVTLLVTFAFSTIVASYVIKPIRILSTAVKKVADGDLNTTIEINRNDEFGELAEGFNNMIRTLHDDIYNIKNAEAQLTYVAYRDPLTGLLNRKSLYDKFAETLAQSKRSHNDKAKGVLVLDFIDFKSVNESYGHHLGDQIIKQAAARIKSVIRETDYAFRLGGDEFAVILNTLAEDSDAALVSEKIIAVLSAPFSENGCVIHLSVCVGIAIYPKDGEDLETLMKNVDTALYETKKEHNSYRFFSNEMQTKAVEKMQIINDLYMALENDEFSLYYQPQINQSGAVVGVEALIRWMHPERGFVSPVKFIPIAEETGIIMQIGAWVLERACMDEKHWQEMGIDDIPVSVNLSARQFRDKELIPKIEKALAVSGISPSLLHLEITESLLMDNFEETIDKVMILREKGIRFSIDDFGTGYSSLSYIKKLPISALKIDRSFIIGIPKNKEDNNLVRAIVSMAKAFDFDLVAEGVEFKEQADFLYALKCNVIQGFLYSKPLPKSEFIDFVRKSKKNGE